MKTARLLLILFLLTFISITAGDDDKDDNKELLKESVLSGLKFRGIGPAWTSGRIADFAVNPDNHSEYYVATASGHLWKTNNSGMTWNAVADTMPYSLSVVKLDPNNYNVVWVGTGENNHQRALGYGDGVYKSTDGGKSFTNVGLRESRQIGGLVIDPRNSEVVYVAAEGSAWGPGGERGLYKTTDGGETWNKVLDISENTGVNNVVFDPRNPDVLYATSEQRRRTPYAKIGGGPESAVYKSTDAGATWKKIMKGLPGGDIGGMGIDISPVNPDVIYLIMEAAEDKGGFFRSTDRGASWRKMSAHHSSGQYYNEIYCDPLDVDKVYSVETRSHVTKDGGKTWDRISNNGRHVDDHALWIDPSNTKHLLIGGDGGVYETYDEGANWLFKSNLPVTQFYRVNVDNAWPFYNIYGGTQDNQSMGGPSRTNKGDGITNEDWFMTVGGDGFFQEIDPTDPNIVYSEWQYGNIIRFDRKSGQTVYIRPEPEKGQKTFKWYWDTPFLISPHSHTRLYIAAERVFRSDDRGESWNAISDDLSTKTDRNSFKVMGKYWSVDAVRKHVSTSQYGLIIAMTESPIKENLIFVGTDDGIIQRTEDASTWTRLDDFPDVPRFTPVHDVVPSRFNENIVYATFNNHKRDDFTPYVLKSTDKGESWNSIASNLPKNGAVNSIIEDPVNPNLLFIGTEWGVYTSVDGGEKWMQLKSGIPKVKVPDLIVQEREKDLVVASFGRGFFVLDDYSALREVNEELLKKDAHIFDIKDAQIYAIKSGKYGQGATYFSAPNPDFGAMLTYYVKDVPKSLKSARKKKEKELFKDGKPIPQPSYEELKAEEDEIAPYLIFSIKDMNGEEVKKLTAKASKGIHRINWDLRYDGYSPISASNAKFNPTKEVNSSLFVLPGKYSVTLSVVAKGEIKELAGPKEFNVSLLNDATIPADNIKEVVAFHRKALDLAKKVEGAQRETDMLTKTVADIRQTVNSIPGASFELLKKVEQLVSELDAISFEFDGEPAKASREEIPPMNMPLSWRINEMVYANYNSTGNILKNQKVALDVLSSEIPEILGKLKEIRDVKLKAIAKELDALGAPWTPGRIPDSN